MSIETIDGRIDAVSVTQGNVEVLFVEKGTNDERAIRLFAIDDTPLPQQEGMRRAAVMNLAQRALTYNHAVRVTVETADGDLALELRISNSTPEMMMLDGAIVEHGEPHLPGNLGPIGHGP
jgi:hypothetical protein